MVSACILCTRWEITRASKSVLQQFSLQSSSCRPNLRTVVRPDLVLELVALTTVLPGEELNTAYTSCQAGTRERRETLWDNWYFSCTCRRCSDPAECGSHYSSLVCSVKRCEGPVLADDPLQSSSDFHCSQCGAPYPAPTVRALLSTALATISQSEPAQYEETLHQVCQHLHTGHHLLLGLKLRLCQIYGGLQDITRPARERRRQLLMEVLDSQTKIKYSVEAADVKILTELMKVSESLAKEDFNFGIIDQERYKQIVMKTKQELVRSILQFKNK